MLQVYHSPEDIREACLVTDLCYETQSNDQAYVSLMSPEDRLDPASFFSDLGAVVVSQGSLDMDGDGVLEYWFVEEDPETFNINWLWVFTYQDGEIVADRMSVDKTEGVKTYILRKMESLPGLPVYEVLSFWSRTFIFNSKAKQLGDFLQPFYLEEEGILDQIETALLTGKDIKEVEQKLLKIQTLTYFISQDRVRYLLGLCAELQGEKGKAAHIYWRLWRDYPRSPYVIIAQSKLVLTSP